MNDIAKGTLAGFIATAPMTLAMAAMFHLLPRGQQYRLPPRQVTMSILGGRAARQRLDERERSNLTLLSHFAYGAACGAAYAPLARWLRPPGAAAGVAHGVAVWSGSYLGWLPALGVMTPATRHPAERNALMIVAHVVWGAATGLLLERLMREEEQVEEARQEQESPSASASAATQAWEQPIGQIH